MRVPYYEIRKFTFRSLLLSSSLILLDFLSFCLISSICFFSQILFSNLCSPWFFFPIDFLLSLFFIASSISGIGCSIFCTFSSVLAVLCQYFPHLRCSRSSFLPLCISSREFLQIFFGIPVNVFGVLFLYSF